jgi:hypothetical protein
LKERFSCKIFHIKIANHVNFCNCGETLPLDFNLLAVHAPVKKHFASGEAPASRRNAAGWTRHAHPPGRNRRGNVCASATV